MKKLLLVLFVAAIGLTACKKDYECCITVFETETCIDYNDLSKTDMEAIEATGYDCTAK